MPDQQCSECGELVVQEQVVPFAFEPGGKQH